MCRLFLIIPSPVFQGGNLETTLEDGDCLVIGIDSVRH